jgi:Uma2 family endonuclease
MVQTLTKPITLEEFLGQPETKPAQEYIEGAIQTKPMPQGKHSRLQLKLSDAINNSTEDKQIALAFPELRCTFANRSIVPDIAVFTWEHLPVNEDGTIGNRFNRHPDWIIEILSPEQSMSLVIKKIFHCLNHGTSLGWIIDPDEKLIFTYTGDHQIQYFEDNNDLIPVPDFAKDLSLTLGNIFDWLQVKIKKD